MSVSGYYILRNGVQIGTSATTTYLDSPPLPDINYSYSVEAYDRLGDVSAASSTLTASTYSLPTTPTGLSTTAITATSMALTWTGSTDTGGPGLAGYYVYRYNTSSGAGTATKIGTTSASTTTYSDTGLSSGVSYSYYVIAYDTNTPVDVSAASSTLTASTYSLNSPAGLQNTTSGILSTAISLSWNASIGNGNTIAGYQLYRNGTMINSANTTSFVDSCLAPGTSYTYKVEAYDSSGNTSALSSPASVTTGPQSLEGDLDGDGTITGHDLSILLAHYGDNYPPAEFDCTSAGTNNVVEGHDLSILFSHYGN